MKITRTLLAVALLSFAATSSAISSDPSNDPIQQEVVFSTKPITGEPLDVYFVNISSNNGCCTANVRMLASGSSPAVAKFGVDDAMWDFKITQQGSAYSVSVLQTNIHTKRTASAEITRADMGHSTNFSFDGYSVTVTSAITAE